MKIAVFGLTGDPVHSGHLEIIERLSKTYDLVVVIPTTIRYYKENKQMFSFSKRFDEIEKKTSKFANVKVSDIERDAPQDWRFINSLIKTIQEFGNDNEYYLAMGSDSFQNFKSWCAWEKITDLVKSIVVFHRPGYEKEKFPTGINYTYVENMNNPISSTALREKIEEKIEEIDLDEMMDDLLFCKGYEEYLEDYHY